MPRIRGGPGRRFHFQPLMRPRLNGLRPLLLIITALILLGIGFVLGSLVRPAFPQGPADIERLERDVRQLTADIVALQIKLAVLEARPAPPNYAEHIAGFRSDIAVIRSQVDDIRTLVQILAGAIVVQLAGTVMQLRQKRKQDEAEDKG